MSDSQWDDYRNGDPENEYLTPQEFMEYDKPGQHAAPSDWLRDRNRSVGHVGHVGHVGGAGEPKPVSVADKKGVADTFYVPHSKSWYRLGREGNYVQSTIEDIKRTLKINGVEGRPHTSGGVSDVDHCIQYIQEVNTVHYAGRFAGYDAGRYLFPDGRILVTESPNRIAPLPGPFELLERIVSGLMGGGDDKQCAYLKSWLKLSVQAIHGTDYAPGQILGLVGPAECGKTLFQSIITALLGGGSADPIPYFVGRSDFNQDLFAACHLAGGDSAYARDEKSRDSLGSHLKAIAAEEVHRMHGKGRDALHVRPKWRMSISCNDEVEKVMVLPQLTPDIIDKIILLKCSKVEVDSSFQGPGGRRLLWRSILKELPCFLHHLLEEYKIPGDIAGTRFGMKAWQNPEIVGLLNSASKETELLLLIDRVLFSDAEPDLMRPWRGQYSGLLLLLKESIDDQKLRSVLYRESNLGNMLGRIRDQYPHRVKSVANHGGTQVWEITPPP